MNDHELEQLYDKHFRRVYRFFYYKVQSKEIAEDLTSEAFLKFINIIKTKDDVFNAEAYLYGVVKLVFMQYLRKKYKDIKTIPIEKEQDFGSYVQEFIKTADANPTAEELALPYIDKLPEKQRIVLKMRLIDKLSLCEIALKLNKDMNYVKTTQKRGIKNLRLLIATFNVHSKQQY